MIIAQHQGCYFTCETIKDPLLAPANNSPDTQTLLGNVHKSPEPRLAHLSMHSALQIPTYAIYTGTNKFISGSSCNSKILLQWTLEKFGLQVISNTLPTQKWFAKYHNTSPLCPLCVAKPESFHYLVTDCPHPGLATLRERLMANRNSVAYDFNSDTYELKLLFKNSEPRIL